MHVTVGQLRSALGDLSGKSKADKNQMRWFTTQMNQLLSDATNAPVDRLKFVVSSADALLSELDKHLAWDEEEWCFDCYASSQTIRNNIYVARRNALARMPGATVAPLAPLPQSTSVIAETARATPAAVAARAQEIARGDVWTEEQRQVFTTPLKVAGVDTSFVPQATAPSQSIQSTPAPSWWDKAIDWASGSSVQTPSAPAATPPVASAPPPATVVRPVVTSPVTPAPSASVKVPPAAAPTPVAPLPSSPSSPAPKVIPASQPASFSTVDALNIFKSITSAASSVSTAFTEGQAARAAAAADRASRSTELPSFELPLKMPTSAAPRRGLGATEAIMIGLGVATAAGVVAVLLMSGNDDD